MGFESKGWLADLIPESGHFCLYWKREIDQILEYQLEDHSKIELNKANSS
jgi:hypothetical protein